MSCVENIAAWREKLEAELGHKVEIDDDVLRKIELNNCICLCKFKTTCPCPESVDEIKEYGRCKCALYYDPTRYRPGREGRRRLRLLQKPIKPLK